MNQMPGGKSPAIETHNLTMRFGDLVAVSGLDLKVHRGDIYGFIGPNGAGKTTTMRILATLLPPTAGGATVNGHDVVSQSERVRQEIGYMPDFAGLYRDMWVDEYLEFFAAAYHLPPEKRKQTVNDVLQLTDLEGKRDCMVGHLSRGMQQRLGLARVLIHDPSVLILDEPASGLDPRARIEIMEILQELCRMGKTIFISSHILSELKDLCKSIGIIEKGKLLYSGSVREAIALVRERRILRVRVRENEKMAGEVLSSHPRVLEAKLHQDAIDVALDSGLEDYSFIADSLVKAGLRVLTISEREIRLEDAFLRLTEGKVA